MAFKLNPQRKETENKTIRFPVPLIEEIEKAIEGNEVSFSHFVIEACKFALENIEDDNGSDKSI
ncbi:MAG: YlcI/YnfO family protein [Erysipelotrichaceae bacterium]